MASRLKVVVNAEHIDNGQRCDPGKCPIALATGGTVGNKVISMPNGEIFLMPKKAMVFIADFDGKYLVHPFSFTAKRY